MRLCLPQRRLPEPFAVAVRAILLAGTASALLAGAASATALAPGGPREYSCPLLPASNSINQDISHDNGSSWYITGAPDPRWNNNDLEQIKRVPGSAFEAVQTGPILHHG
jgi:hypothetical protein